MNINMYVYVLYMHGNMKKHLYGLKDDKVMDMDIC
jgi:hypothetical protein